MGRRCIAEAARHSPSRVVVRIGGEPTLHKIPLTHTPRNKSPLAQKNHRPALDDPNFLRVDASFSHHGEEPTTATPRFTPAYTPPCMHPCTAITTVRSRRVVLARDRHSEFKSPLHLRFRSRGMASGLGVVQDNKGRHHILCNARACDCLSTFRPARACAILYYS